MIAKEVFDAIDPVITVLDKMAVSYVIGGSVASSTYGIGRATADVDIVVDLQAKHVAQMVAELEDQYYIDGAMLSDTVQRRSSCNLIFLPNMTKIDIFIPKQDEFDRQQLRHAIKEEFELGGSTRILNLAAPEDIVLQKLRWYEQGGSTSERQWNDVLGVLKVQAHYLDREYMHHWGRKLNIAELLERALDDAGLPPLEEVEF